MYFVLIPYQFTTSLHSLLECPIATALFKNNGYDFTSCNNSVIDIVYNIDVIIPILKIDSS